MADRPAARTAAEAARSTSPQPPARSASNRCRQPTGLDSPRSPFSTPISTSAASIAASSLSLSDSAQAVSAHWTDAISASSVLSTSPDSSCSRNSPPRPQLHPSLACTSLLPSGVDQPRRTPSTKPRPRLPAPYPFEIRGGRVVGVVSELKAQVRRGCSGAQVWTPSPPIRPHFCPPLRPHLERSAAGDSAPPGTGPTPRTNWPSRWTRRTRKAGARRQACVAGHLRPDLRRFGEERVPSQAMAGDLLFLRPGYRDSEFR
jgi:hypothetical protein